MRKWDWAGTAGSDDCFSLLGCVFLCFTFRNDTVPSPQGNGLGLVHFPSNCSWTVGTRTGPHISDHPFLPMAFHSSHLKSRAQRLWENTLILTWGIPFYTHQWQLPESLLPLPESAMGGWEGCCSSLWCLKQVSTLVITSLPTTVAFLNLISCCVGGWF